MNFETIWKEITSFLGYTINSFGNHHFEYYSEFEFYLSMIMKPFFNKSFYSLWLYEDGVKIPLFPAPAVKTIVGLQIQGALCFC